jgi:hypothetical protein
MVTRINIKKTSPKFIAWVKQHEVEMKERFKKYFEKIPKRV